MRDLQQLPVGVPDHGTGRDAPGMQADIAVLNADAADAPSDFAAVRCTIRGGKIIFSR